MRLYKSKDVNHFSIVFELRAKESRNDVSRVAKIMWVGMQLIIVVFCSSRFSQPFFVVLMVRVFCILAYSVDMIIPISNDKSYEWLE